MGECSASCGGAGAQRWRRRCDRPAPFNGGDLCLATSGSRQLEEDKVTVCGLQPCPGNDRSGECHGYNRYICRELRGGSLVGLGSLFRDLRRRDAEQESLRDPAGPGRRRGVSEPGGGGAVQHRAVSSGLPGGAVVDLLTNMWRRNTNKASDHLS